MKARATRTTRVAGLGRRSVRDLTRCAVGALPLRWCAFASLVFFHAFCWAMFIAWTPIAFEMGWNSRAAAFCVWIGLALGVMIGASACATAWALVLMDEGGRYPPCSPGGHRSRRPSARTP